MASTLGYLKRFEYDFRAIKLVWREGE